METPDIKTASLQSIHIKGLFDMFSYNVEFKKNENVLILTGANGFGKTQILNIIYNLFNKNFSFFDNLVFSRIDVVLNNSNSITIEKKFTNQIDEQPLNSSQQSLFDELPKNLLAKKKIQKVFFTFFIEGKEIASSNLSDNISDRDIDRLDRFLPIDRIDERLWLDMTTDDVLSLSEVIERYSKEFPVRYLMNLETNFKLDEQLGTILNSISVHLIREQRLFKKVKDKEDVPFNRFKENQTVMEETVKIYANELVRLINQKMKESFDISQELDRTYPRRLISIDKKVSEQEYNDKYTKLSEKIEKLAKNGLYDGQQEKLAYKKDDAKALSVYLADLEKKFSVFDDLLEKLELFSNTLNERRFTFKSIVIDKEKGFYFKTENEKPLELNELSSGEQHELILLYELIFKTNKRTLVLIDEPEISLHVTWQKEFLNDLLKIIQVQGFQVIIATHAPAIINDRWDLVYTLERNPEKD